MTATITPIRGAETQPPGDGPKPPRRRRKHDNILKLRASGDGEDFDTLDLINGLRGVCRALDEVCVTDGCRNVDLAGDLSQAAKALSEMLGNRVEV